ncbi:hypothetical protein lpa_03197 [Legionella pneumophila 2300/99 Alcoy]|nr:hypothetical protein lpa_03197 [Legionella pneumophila 2300/99 Alcoy]
MINHGAIIQKTTLIAIIDNYPSQPIKIGQNLSILIRLARNEFVSGCFISQQ